MGKSVWCDDETYEKIINESHKIGVPISQLLKVVVKNEEKMRKNEEKIEKEKIEKREEKKEEKNLKRKEEKTKKMEVKMPEFDEKKVEDLIEKVLSEKQEKESVRKEIGELKKGVETMQKLFCTPDGKKCFVTPGELAEFERKQRQFVSETLEEVNRNLSELRDRETRKQVKELAEEPGVESLRSKRWDDMSPAEQQAVKSKLDKEYSHRAMAEVLFSCPECFSRLTKRESVREAVLENLSDEELLNRCDLGNPEACKILAERGYRVQQKDERGKWKTIAEPKEEKSKSKF